MKTSDVINHFINHKMAHTPYRNAPLNGVWAWRGASLTSNGYNLTSYETTVARWDGAKILITDKKYSATTSRQVSTLRNACAMAGIATGALC